MNSLHSIYSLYHAEFSPKRILLCIGIVQITAIFDLIFSSIGLCYGLTCLIIDQLSTMKIFQSNEILHHLRQMPMRIFFDKRILFRSFWTIDLISKKASFILPLHVLSTSLTIFCSISMLTAIQYNKFDRGNEK